MTFPYKRYRPGQREIAEAVKEATEQGNALLLQAPTGIGKTAAVIDGILRSRVRNKVLYIVRTRNEIAPVVRELTRFGVEYTFIFSAKVMCPFSSSRDEEEVESFWEKCKLLKERGKCIYYNTLLQIRDKKTIKEVIREGGEDPYFTVALFKRNKVCPFYALREIIEDARFIVATYPYLFENEIFSSVFEPYDYKDFIVVVDEAHSLIDFPSMLEKRISLTTLRKALKEIEGIIGKDSMASKSLKEALKYLNSAISPGEAIIKINKKVITEILGDPLEWINLSTEIKLRSLEENDEETIMAKPIYTYSLAKFYQYLTEDGIELYASGEKDTIILHAVPIDPCKAVSKPLNEAHSIILMSGTMPPLEYYKLATCLNRDAKIVITDDTIGSRSNVANIKDLRRTYITIIASYLSSKYMYRSDQTYLSYAQLINIIYSLAKYSVLVVYPSYEFMNNVLKYLGQMLDTDSMIVEDKKTVISGIINYVLSERHVLINAVAGGKLVEGVEYVDEKGRSLLNTVVVAGVPYPQPNSLIEDYIEAIMRRHSGKEQQDKKKNISKSSFYNLLASLRTRQALGRAIRGENDKAIFVLADKRFLYGELRKLMFINYDFKCTSLDECSKLYTIAQKKLKLV
ncbi:MAG: ATP-dependent DNA helicase [Pyrodictiaceae archaeon]